MTLIFEELDYQQTPHGDISLRRRSEPRLQDEIVFEVKLGDEFLMSSLFPDAEIQLAHLALTHLDLPVVDVVVGGLGLGYTAAAVLEHEHVRSLHVIELMKPVIDWHERGLVPLGRQLSNDPRCHFIQADFFALAGNSAGGFDQHVPGRRFHAILLDIDHSPSHWLASENSQFYCEDALTRMAEQIHPGGVFGLWSNEPADADFIRLLESVFTRVTTQVVEFPNPYQGGLSSNTIYLAHVASAQG